MSGGSIQDVLRQLLDTSAEDALAKACEEIIMLRAANDDLNTIAVFWRQAAEHAVTGWNALEDKYEALLKLMLDTRNKLDQVADKIENYTDDREEWAPPEHMTPLTSKRLKNFDDTSTLVDEIVDLGDGVKHRVVEEETPR